MKALSALAAVGLALVCGCSDSRSHARAICVLVDISGTYADQREDVSRIIRSGLLPKVLPGDSFIIIRINEKSYDRSSVEAAITFDSQPSRANAQKLSLAGRIDKIAQSRTNARFTDISGALLLATEYLRETRAGQKSIVIFSDMREELPKGAQRNFEPKEFQGIHILAMNVKRLAADNLDPTGYRKRLGEWEAKLTRAGAASWKVILDPEELAREFTQGL